VVELTAIVIGSGLGILVSIPVSVGLVLALNARVRGSVLIASPRSADEQEEEEGGAEVVAKVAAEVVARFKVGDWVRCVRQDYPPVKIITVSTTDCCGFPYEQPLYYFRWRHASTFHYQQWSSDFGSGSVWEDELGPCRPEDIPTGTLADVGEV